MQNVIKIFSRKLKDLKMGKYVKKSRLDKYREPNPMNEVFFYDPYKKKPPDTMTRLLEQMRLAIIKSKIKTEEAIKNQPMNEVFFYDPYKKKIEMNIGIDASSAIEAFKKLGRSLIKIISSCNDLEKGMQDVMRHMGKRSGT